MRFSPPLSEGKQLRRYKRFFCDIETPSGVLTAHVPNTGSLKGCLSEGQLCRYSVANDPQRKLKGTLEMVRTPTSWVGVHTGHPNQLFADTLINREPHPFQDYPYFARECTIHPSSRLDFVLCKQDRLSREPKAIQNALARGESLEDCLFIEIKSVTMSEGRLALFPDGKTSRGLKHIQDLMNLRKRNAEAALLFVIQREDTDSLSPNADLDPEYTKALRSAISEGLKVVVVSCTLSADSLHLNWDRKIEFI